MCSTSGSLPTNLCSGRQENFHDFVEAMCHHEDEGIEAIRDLLKSKGNKVTRFDIWKALKRTIQVCGDTQGGRVGFIASKIISDIEVVFPGVFGQATYDSISLGVGGSNGLECVRLEGYLGSRTKERFLQFHEEIKDFLCRSADDCFSHRPAGEGRTMEEI